MGPANSGANASRSLLRAPRFALSSSRQPLFDAEGSASCAGRVTINHKNPLAHCNRLQLCRRGRCGRLACWKERVGDSPTSAFVTCR